MSVLSPLRRFVTEKLLYTDAAPDDEAAFGRYANGTTARIASAMAVVFCVLPFIWWLADFVLFPEEPDIRAKSVVWRFLNLAVLSPVPIVLALSRRVRARPVPLVMVCQTAACAALTWTTGSIGRSDPAWFGATYLLPVVSIMLAVGFPVRLFHTLLLAAASWCGFFVLTPRRLAEESFLGLTIFQELITVALSVAIGHVMYHSLRTGYFARRALLSVNDQLAEQVRSQSADLRRLADRIIALRDQERADVARELHDELGQALTALRFEVASLANTAERIGVKLQTGEVDFLMDELFATFRRMLRGLRPRILDDLGLAAAAAWLIQDQRQQTGLDISLEISPSDFQLGGDLATAVFHILSDSLANVAQHARATHVQVSLTLQDGLLQLVVRDDGCGIPAREAWRPQAVGIIAMRERARAAGGELEVVPATDRGTEVRLRLPLQAVRAAA